MSESQVKILEKFLNIPPGHGRVLGLYKNKFFSHGNSLPVAQVNGSGIVSLIVTLAEH